MSKPDPIGSWFAQPGVRDLHLAARAELRFELLDGTVVSRPRIVQSDAGLEEWIRTIARLSGHESGRREQ